MSRVVPFRGKKPDTPSKGNTLCRRGFHKWEIVHDRPFDTKQGRLVTMERCKRCGATRNRAK